MFECDRFTDRRNHVVQVCFRASVYLLDDDQSFLTAGFDSERRAAARPECGVTTFHNPLDILRIMVQAANDDEVLDAAGDVQFTVFDEAQIFSAQEWTFAGIG